MTRFYYFRLFIFNEKCYLLCDAAMKIRMAKAGTFATPHGRSQMKSDHCHRGQMKFYFLSVFLFNVIFSSRPQSGIVSYSRSWFSGRLQIGVELHCIRENVGDPWHFYYSCVKNERERKTMTALKTGHICEIFPSDITFDASSTVENHPILN